jgi:hypothetical protein
MPINRPALKSRLVQLAQEYREFVELTEQHALEPDEHRLLLSQRSVVHDQLIDIFTQLGIAFVDRHDVRRQALAIAQRGRL